MYRVFNSLARESVSLAPKIKLILDKNGFATLKKGLGHEQGFLLKETRSSMLLELTAFYPVRVTCELQKKDFNETEGDLREDF